MGKFQGENSSPNQLFVLVKLPGVRDFFGFFFGGGGWWCLFSILGDGNRFIKWWGLGGVIGEAERCFIVSFE